MFGPSDESEKSDGVGGSVSEHDAEEDPFPRLLFGQRLKRVSRKRGGVEYPGLEVRCFNPAHHAASECSRYRALTLDVDRFGVLAPVVFLGTWLLYGHECDTKRKHKGYNPTVKAMQEYKETYVD